MHRRLQRALFGFAIFAVMISRSMACSVPVFRYALERWLSDPYQATVFYREALTAEETKTVSLIEASHANLEMTLVNLDSASEAQSAVWEEQESEILPWLFVGYPDAHPVAVELAAGPLEDGFAKEVLDTPFRVDIGQQLVSGQTAVWVMLESGDSAKDEAVWKLLNEQLSELEATLELPTIEAEDIELGLISVDEDELRIAFSTLRLSREKPADEMLVRMLLDTEEDLIDRQVPMVFPIFGRGRVLYGLVGEGISPETIELAAIYLAGACSCQVKAENPGVDLLMAVNWNDLVESSLETDREIPELTGILPQPPTGGSVPVASVVTASSPSNLPPMVAATAPQGNDNRLLWTTLAAMVLMLLVVALGSTLFANKKA